MYALPFKKEDLIKAISDPRVHFAHFKHAIDFVIPVGTTILAPKAGIVTGIKVNSRKGGTDPKYNSIKYLNYMTLKHPKQEYSQYLHLKHRGALVRAGEKVRTGQPIAVSGNTGFSTTPHLHFQVFKANKSGIGWETLKIRFKERICIDKKARTIPNKLETKLRKAFEGNNCNYPRYNRSSQE